MKKLLLTLFLIFNISIAYGTEKREFPDNGIMTFGGLDNTSQPPLAKDNRASDLQNVVLDITGSMEKRNGYSLFSSLDTNDTVDSFEAVTSFYELYKSNGTRYRITTCGSKIFSLGTDGIKTNITSGLIITEGQDNQFNWITALDNAIGTNNVDLPIKWNGTGMASEVSFTGLTSPITKARCVVWWKNYLIFGNTAEGGTSYTTRIRWSNVGTIGTWSDNDYVDIATLGGQQIEGFGLLYDDLYVFLTDSIYKVSLVGGEELINVSKISEGIGCIAKLSIQTIGIGNTQGLIFLSRDKSINYLDGIKVTDISTLIRSTTDNFSTARLSYAVSINDVANARYYLCITDSTDSISTTTNNLLLDYYYQTGEWSKHSQIDANALGIANDINSNPQIYAGNYKSFIYQLNNTSYNNDVAGLIGRFEAVDTINTATASGLQVLYDSDLTNYDKLLLHCEGVTGSKTFIDEAGNTVTAVSDAQISTAQYKFGSASGLFDGINDYITVPDSDDWNFGSGDFTIDCWLRPNGLTDYNRVFSTSSSDYTGFLISLYADGTVDFKIGNGSSWALNINTGAGAVSTGSWYHIAIVRSGTNVKVYVNGTSLASGTYSGSAGDSGDICMIGAWLFGSGVGYLNGNMDEFRISKGLAEWTANFTPPTSAYDNSNLSTRYEGATITITSGTGNGEERVVCDTTATGIVVTNSITSGINATYSIGAIDAYYVLKWNDCGNAAILKNFGELYIWAETQQSQTMQVDYATEQSSTIESQNVNLYGGDIFSGTTIIGDSTWSGIRTNFCRIPVNVSGRFIKTRFREDDIDATMKLYGYGYLYWTRSEP